MQNKTIKINTLDGHTLGGYLAATPRPPKGGVIVLQEIFGVTAHIRKVGDGFAAHGYLALAPALFDRLEPGIELEYSADRRGLALMQKLKLDDVATDLSATVAALRRDSPRYPALAPRSVQSVTAGAAPSPTWRHAAPTSTRRCPTTAGPTLTG